MHVLLPALTVVTGYYRFLTDAKIVSAVQKLQFLMVRMRLL